jgi:serine/threonine-protein kinase
MVELGEYRIVRTLGEGGMGTVHEAEERLTGRRVAVKVARPELARTEEGRRLFLNEMRILAKLEHPNVVRCLAATEVDGQLVLALELVEGRTLRARLAAEGRLPWQEAARVAAAVAAALGAAHSQSPPIVHRDLKPENVLLGDDGSIKVTDFGVAKVLEAAHAPSTQSVGTLTYLSPEQIDARVVDHRADLYALGLVLHEMLAGEPPFRAASPRKLLDLQCTAEPPPLPEDVRATLPRGVEELVAALLEKAPEDRPYLAEDVVARLAPFQPAAPVAGRPTERVPREATRAKEEPATAQPSSKRAGEPAKAKPEAASPRADTVEIIDRVAPRGELSGRAGAAIVVGLSIAAGVAAYAARASEDRAEVRPAVTRAAPPPLVLPARAARDVR